MHGAPVAATALVLLLLLAGASCRRAEPDAPTAPPAPPVEGTVTVPGLKGAVTVVRDERGIPHITAATTDDLFFAQGFVQAQDRLFQMDLWKRAAQGRLAEVLGANFIQRDSMTRRIQFRGDYAREWASYGPEARQIAVAFTNGINAWVAEARRTVPEEFAVAGWLPEFWKPEDLLNRTDAFLASGNAMDDLFRGRMVAALGAARVDQLLPLPRGARTVTDLGVDLSAITFVVSDALRRLGTPPFFTTLTNPVSEAPRPSRTTGGADVVLTDSEDRTSPVAPGRDIWTQAARISGGAVWAVPAARSATNAPLLAVSEFNRFETPARRYLVHLTAPGLDIIGATSPWLPGVAIGHNRSVAWAFTPSDDDTQDVFVERVNPDNAHQVARDGRWVDMAVDIERVSVLGRDKPVEYERLYTPNGVVIAQDRERHLVFTLRWVGTEPGGAGELAALALLRVSTVGEFRQALSAWKAPAAEFVAADLSGGLLRQRAGLVPVRADGRGAVPAAAWLSSRTWLGFTELATRAEPLDVDGRVVLGSALPTAARRRVSTLLSQDDPQSVAGLAAIQADVASDRADALVNALEEVRVVPRNLLEQHRLLLTWDRRLLGDAPAAALYVVWEAAVRKRLAARLVKPELVDEFAARLDPVVALEGPPSAGAGGDTGPWRDILLVDALSDAVRELQPEETTRSADRIVEPQVTFAHPLGVFAIGRARFNVGPFPLGGHTDTVFATDGRRGPAFRAVFDVGSWDRSLVVNAPGQSGSPSSPNYDDQAGPWAAGSLSNLLFDRKDRLPEAGKTLTLEPR